MKTDTILANIFSITELINVLLFMLNMILNYNNLDYTLMNSLYIFDFATSPNNIRKINNDEPNRVEKIDKQLNNYVNNVSHLNASNHAKNASYEKLAVNSPKINTIRKINYWAFLSCGCCRKYNKSN